MKPAPFTYHRPASVDEALALLAEHGDEAKILAGGQSLLPVMGLRLAAPAHLVDIGRLPGLDGIDTGPDGTRIGALVTHGTAERSDELARHCPLIHQAMPHIGHRAIRTRGTVVGSIAHADPAAEMPAVCLALGATMHLVSDERGERTVAAGDFFEGYLTTALEPDELFTAVSFPVSAPGTGTALFELSRRHGDYALAGLACSITAPAGTVEAVALSFLGVASTPVRVTEAEEALIGRVPDNDAFADAATIVNRILEPTADVHATTAYRKHLAGVLTRRGLAQATSRIGVTA